MKDNKRAEVPEPLATNTAVKRLRIREFLSELSFELV